MRYFGVWLVAVLAAVLFVYPASAERGSWKNWHVHDGGTGTVDSSGLRHLGVVFFPLIFGPDYASTPSLWAYCTDATDKSLVGGDGGAMLVSGQCRNEDNIIHLKGVETGSPAPPGWTLVTTAGGGAFEIYYRLTPR
ncbi:MAG: hypothetical protein M3546_07645 [Actinomycetota bacterium]|nr:hypothetical protein [Actinomycetota bacterium]